MESEELRVDKEMIRLSKLANGYSWSLVVKADKISPIEIERLKELNQELVDEWGQEQE